MFEKLKYRGVKNTENNQWTNNKTNEKSNDFTIAFFGKTGYGKSSTVNSFFGRNIMETSDISACTRVCNCLDYEMSPGNYLSLGDFPGIGETEYKNIEYLNLYKEFIESVSIVIYIMRADTRDYSIDEKAYSTIFTCLENKKKVIFALNQCDKVEPINRKSQKEPTAEQMRNIEEKVKFLQEKFQPINLIIPYSAATGWNMDALADEMVNVAMKSENLYIELNLLNNIINNNINNFFGFKW